jgi:hypothetical protein
MNGSVGRGENNRKEVVMQKRKQGIYWKKGKLKK